MKISPFNIIKHNRLYFTAIKSKDSKQITSSKGVICDKKTAIMLKNMQAVNSSQYIDNDDSLFPWAQNQSKLSLEKDIDPKSLVLVHMTNYFPHEGKIIPTANTVDNNDYRTWPRNTVHFALNKAVTEHEAGADWDNMNYSIIMPFVQTADMKDNVIVGGFQDDLFFNGEVKLPQGSIILKHNENIPKNKLKISKAKDGEKFLKGIILIETSEKNLGQIVNKIVKKMGYTNYFDVEKEYLGANEEEYYYLKATSRDIGFNMDEWNKKFKIQDKYIEKINNNLIPLAKKTWHQFFEKYNYFEGLHSESPFARSEEVFFTVALLEIYNQNSWHLHKNSPNIHYDCDLQKSLIEVINQCEKELPEGCEFGYDTKKAKKIILESKTPKEAIQKLCKEFKITTDNLYKNSKDETSFEFMKICDELPFTLSTRLQIPIFEDD